MRLALQLMFRYTTLIFFALCWFNIFSIHFIGPWVNCYECWWKMVEAQRVRENKPINHFLKVKIHILLTNNIWFKLYTLQNIMVQQPFCIVNYGASRDIISDIWFWYKGRQMNFWPKIHRRNGIELYTFALMTRQNGSTHINKVSYYNNHERVTFHKSLFFA